jgi:ubiquinone/menaquinone biosynthesis C-methylase UbiE
VAQEAGPTADIYDPAFVRGVFDRCSRRYLGFSRLCSFGFTERWRRQCVEALPAANDPFHCYDLMAGTGEVWPHLLRRFPNTDTIVAVDFSSGMHRQAMKRLHAHRRHRIQFVEHDMLTSAIPPGVADAVISTFGLKTFNLEQQALLAAHVARTLMPGGTFSFIEASDPKGWWLRPLYLFHLKMVLPLVERLLLRGAQDFAMIGTYCTKFGDASHFAALLRQIGLEVEYRKYFFGCATGVSGRKPVV